MTSRAAKSRIRAKNWGCASSEIAVIRARNRPPRMTALRRVLAGNSLTRSSELRVNGEGSRFCGVVPLIPRSGN